MNNNHDTINKHYIEDLYKLEMIFGKNVEGNEYWSLAKTLVEELIKLIKKSRNVNEVELEEMLSLLEDNNKILELENGNKQEYSKLNEYLSLNDKIKENIFNYTKTKIYNYILAINEDILVEMQEELKHINVAENEEIKNLNNNDEIQIDLFGHKKWVTVFSTGDNMFDENGNYKDDNFELNQEELNVLNWFIKNIKIEDYKKEIMDYCNKEYSSWQYEDGTQEGPIEIDDVENEINITSIAINLTDTWKANDGFVYPEISFYGECNCDEEHGICIGFRDKKFIGINSQDWTL